MTIVRTQLATVESARRERVEPTGGIMAVNVQKALEGLDTGKVSQVGNARLPASTATVAILTTDIEVGIDTRTTAVTANLPSAAAWAAANPNGLELTLVDIFGNAGTNNITPALSGADTFFYGSVTPIILTNFGLLKLRPAGAPVTGWYVRGLN